MDRTNALTQCSVIRKLTIWGSFLVGLLLSLTGIYLEINFQSMIKSRINEAVAIRKCSEAGSRFEDPPAPTLVYITLFNVTNPEEVNEGLQIPDLEEVGPFVYRLEKRKVIQQWDNKLGTVTYREIQNFHFEKSLSIGQPEDFHIYHVNVPHVAIAEKVSPVARYLFSLGPFLVKHSAAELMFQGYRVKFLDKLETMTGSFMKIPNKLPNNTFGVFYGKNDTMGKEITVQTGINDIANLGNFIRYNHSGILPYWLENSTCNELRGTDGSFFPPYLDKSQPIYVFSPEICRTLALGYRGTHYVNGIETYRYTVPTESFDTIEDNRCYCLEDDLTKCQKAGILLLRTCLDGAPVAASAPHFYLSDQEYLKDFNGLAPEKEKHGSFADIDPLTGLVLRGKRKLQINIQIPKENGWEFLNLPKKISFFPILWINEEGIIPPDRVSEFKWRVAYPVKYGTLVVKITLGLGMALLVISSVFLAKSFWLKRRELKVKKDVGIPLKTKNWKDHVNGVKELESVNS